MRFRSTSKPSPLTEIDSGLFAAPKPSGRWTSCPAIGRLCLMVALPATIALSAFPFLQIGSLRAANPRPRILVLPGAIRLVPAPFPHPADRFVTTAPSGIDEAMIITAKAGIDEAMLCPMTH